MGDIVDGMFESGMMDMPDPFDHRGQDEIDDCDDVVEYMANNGWAPRRTRRAKYQPTCTHCGKRGLNWQMVKGSTWRLHDGREVHDCLTKTPTADGFDDEPIL